MFGLYVHIPFCRRRCAYCDFPSTSVWDEELLLRYVEAILRDLSQEKWRIKVPYTLYIGGGTPSILPPKLLDKLLGWLKVYLPLPVEWTIEANPESLSREKLKILSASGVNRLSLGVQSFHDLLLKILGRIHTGREAREKAALAREYFENLNLDLIFASPTQTLHTLEADLVDAISLKPAHISAYGLTLEQRTPLAEGVENGELVLPKEEEWLQMFELIPAVLEEAGFYRYEISNYAREGFYCHHNLNYWRNGEYLGIGASAVSHLNDTRLFREKDPVKYIELVEGGGSPVVEREVLTPVGKVGETIMMQLRTRKGFDWQEIEKKGGVKDKFEERIRELLSLGLLEEKDGRYRIPEKYFHISNHIMSMFID